VTALVRGAGDDAVLALVDRSSIWRIAGTTAEPIATLDEPVASCIASRPDGSVLVGTSDLQILTVADGQVVALDGFATVEGRERWYQPWGDPAVVRSLAIDAKGTMFANMHVGGIARSDDDGATWHATAIDIDHDVHQIVSPAGGHLLAACGDGGLATTDDGGDSWTFTTDGLDVTYCRAVAASDDAVVLSASSGPRTDRGALYRRTRDDGPFERCTDWHPHNIDTGCLHARGGVVAYGTPDGACRVSDDAGASWRDARDGLPPVTAVLVRTR
jgi:hypothetical protein